MKRALVIVTIAVSACDPPATKPTAEPIASSKPKASASTASVPASATASASSNEEKLSVSFPPKPAPLPLTELKHGSSLWAVYLHVGKSDDAAFKKARAAWEATKLPLSIGEASCDEGSIAAGVPAGSWAIGAYFKSKKDAEAFRDGVTPKPGPLGQVKVMCAD